jgi:hypothetical protein
VAHLGEVDHEPAVDDAVSGRIVTPSAHCELEPVRTGKGECGNDVSGSSAAGDQRRTAVDRGVEGDARGVVARVAGAENNTRERLLQLISRSVVYRPILLQVSRGIRMATLAR